MGLIQSLFESLPVGFQLLIPVYLIVCCGLGCFVAAFYHKDSARRGLHFCVECERLQEGGLTKTLIWQFFWMSCGFGIFLVLVFAFMSMEVGPPPEQMPGRIVLLSVSCGGMPVAAYTSLHALSFNYCRRFHDHYFLRDK